MEDLFKNKDLFKNYFYKSSIDLNENGFNVMNETQREFQIPNPNEYRKDIYMININSNIIEKINNKEDLIYKEIIKNKTQEGDTVSLNV